MHSHAQEKVGCHKIVSGKCFVIVINNHQGMLLSWVTQWYLFNSKMFITLSTYQFTRLQCSKRLKWMIIKLEQCKNPRGMHKSSWYNYILTSIFVALLSLTKLFIGLETRWSSSSQQRSLIKAIFLKWHPGKYPRINFVKLKNTDFFDLIKGFQISRVFCSWRGQIFAREMKRTFLESTVNLVLLLVII